MITIAVVSGPVEFQSLRNTIGYVAETNTQDLVVSGGVEYRRVDNIHDVEGRWFDACLYLYGCWETRIMKYMSADEFERHFVRKAGQ